MLSKSLCHVQNHTFGLVPTNRYFHDSNKSDFCSKPPESLYLQASYYPYSFTLVINTTVSTWPDCFGLMSIYCKCVPAVYGNLSNGRISRNVVKIQPCPFSKKCLSKDCKNTESRNNRFPYLNYFYFWETVILSSLSQFATSTIFIPSY